MKPLALEIYGVGTWNRGAELMTIAVSENIRKRFPGARVAVSPWFGSFESRGHYNLHTVFEDGVSGPWHGRWRLKAARAALGFLSPGSLPGFGMMLPKEVDVVLDASGFAFSDQWGPDPARRLLRKMEASVYRGKPLFLLPQALGPFRKPEVANACRRLFSRADWMAARDNDSLGHVRGLGSYSNLRLYPDFTSSIHGLGNFSGKLPSPYVAVVPNARILDKTAQGQSYLEFLVQVAGYLDQRGHHPVFVIHDEFQDKEIFNQVQARAGRPWICVDHKDPRVLKTILGGASFVIGSRFHALISALSQSVPCLGIGWSHKYETLFHEFGIQQCLLRDFSTWSNVEPVLAKMMTEQGRKNCSKTIHLAANKQRQLTENMWVELCDLIEKKTGKKPNHHLA